MNQPPGLPPPGGRTQQAAHLARMGGTSPAPPPGLPQASNQAMHPAHHPSANSSLPPPPPGLQLPLPGIAQLQGVTPTASPPPPGLGAVGMGMANNNGMSNGHGFNMQGMPPQYQHQVAQHSTISPQPTLGTAQSQQNIGNQPQTVPAPPPSVDGANVSRAQVSFLINGLKEETWERQLGEIRNVSLKSRAWRHVGSNVVPSAYRTESTRDLSSSPSTPDQHGTTRHLSAPAASFGNRVDFCSDAVLAAHGSTAFGAVEHPHLG